MHIIVGLALGLIVVGLVMCWLSGGMKYPVLVSVVHWVGIVLVVVGLILLLTPAIVWLDHQLRSMLGA